MLATGIITGLSSARPAAAWNGRLWLPTDGATLQRDSGTAWLPWGPLFPFTDPNLTTFSGTNMGTATVTVTGATLFLNAPSTTSDQIRIQEMTVPATPYTLTMAYLPSMPCANFLAVGICLRDSAGLGVITFGPEANATSLANALQFQVNKWTNPTTFSATYALTPAVAPVSPWLAGPCMWVQIHDDGTTRSYQVANDGVNFATLLSTTHTDFLTPTRIGFFANPNGTGAVNFAAGIRVLSWLAH